MPRHHRKRLSHPGIRQHNVRMTDSRRDHPDQNLAIVEFRRDFDILHGPIVASMVAFGGGL